MDLHPLTEADRDLIGAAREALASCYDPGKHSVGAAVRTTAGSMFSGVDLATAVDTHRIHAEPVAIGQAVLAGEETLEASVAVSSAEAFEAIHAGHSGGLPASEADEEFQVISACGGCRELLRGYGDPDELMIFVPGEDGPAKASLADLLPKA